ncbi:MAG: SMP-30/gluconolactonase/LRE family protein [Propionibacteriaceae bacterium]|jgi:gluconolactonase|nr:SMP-30/gluconolactonase/LRE family protein [Propionibacteriaceae bacterium]
MELPDDFSLIAKTIGFTEGPVWTSDNRLLVTSLSRGLVYSLDISAQENGAVDPIGAYETGGAPNGLAEGPGGTIYVAQNGDAAGRSRSTRPVTPGLQTIIGGEVSDLPVCGANAPNDLAVDPNGRVWFTDPDAVQNGGAGSKVCIFDPANGQVDTVITDLSFPNGLAFSPDCAELYVADSLADAIVRYRIDGGIPTEPSLFAQIPGMNPDGIAFDTNGNLYVAGFESNDVIVLDGGGGVLRRISTGGESHPTNLCFAGPNLDILVVTLLKGGRVAALKERIPGIHSRTWEY